MSNSIADFVPTCWSRAHVTILKNGITRMVNNYREEADGKVG
jgi:hypothetical protein